MDSFIEWFLAGLGLAISWLINLNRDQKKVGFTYRKFLNYNLVLIITTLCSTTALMFLTPMVLELFGYVEAWGKMVAFIGGLLNLKIVTALKVKVLDKIKPSRK